jgi:hypothetical protein
MFRARLVACVSLVWSTLCVGGCFAPAAQPQPECTSDADCSFGGDCVIASCNAGTCVSRDAPAGSIPSAPLATAGPCQRVVCDGKGNDKLEPDPANVPTEGAPACKKYVCDAEGHETTAPDPNNLPAPGTTPGACTKGGCDDKGNETSVADPSNPPPPDACNTYACNGTTPVPTPTPGKVCSSLGMACDAHGACDVCPPVDASCADPGPGATAHTLGTAHSFGTIGLCDGDGSTLCGALTGGEESWFTYTSCGSLSLCSFDPFVSVEATGTVELCEYFQCSR